MGRTGKWRRQASALPFILFQLALLLAFTLGDKAQRFVDTLNAAGFTNRNAVTSAPGRLPGTGANHTGGIPTLPSHFSSSAVA